MIHTANIVMWLNSEDATTATVRREKKTRETMASVLIMYIIRLSFLMYFQG